MLKHILKLTIIINLLIILSCASGSKSAPASGSGFANESLDYRLRRSEEVSAESRMITYSASLELSVKDIEKTRNTLTEQVKNNNGFIVRETENSITTQIPAPKMDSFIDYAKTLGSVERETKTGRDITDQYRDNVLRLDSLKSVRNRYLALLQQAKTVSDILSIEKELERVNLEIERLEGQIKHAELSVTYSSVTVRFNEKVKPGPLGWVLYGFYRGVRWLFVWN